MAERLNRDPSYDLTRHIATGEKPPLSGDPNLRQFDAELDRNDPMDPFTAAAGPRLTVHQPDDTNLVTGWDTGDGKKDQEAVDLAQANDWSDEPSKGGLAYGPRNTDSQKDAGGY